MRLWLIPSVLALLAQQAAPDRFLAQHDTAVAAVPISARFSIAFADERRAFHPGETIPLVFAYDGLSPTPYNYEHMSHLGLARAVLDHQDGAVYPFADFDRAGYSRGGILGGVVGCLVVGTLNQIDVYGNPLPPPRQPPCPAITFTVYLNQDVRFDRPGHYRFYVVDDHVSFLQRSDGQKPLPTLPSNILELDIVAPDREWAEKTGQDAIAMLDEPHADTTRLNAARTLAFLGTAEAVDEMISRLARTDELGSIRSRQSFFFVKGLFGARDRRDLVARMRRQAATTPVPSRTFMQTLTAITRGRK